MTTKEKLKAMLTERGMFDDQADEVLKEAIPQIESLAPDHRYTWDSPASGYPDVFYNAMWITLRKVAQKWIKDNMPEAWFLPMFE